MAASPAGLLLGRRDGKRYGTMPGERKYYSASHGLVLVAGLVLGAVLGPATRLAAGSAATLLAALPGGPDVAARSDVVFELVAEDIVGDVAGTQRVFSVFDRGLQGPTRRVALGDVVEVRVTNNRPSGLTLHHHGIHQVGTPYNDGASMVTQAPIAPGGSMTYRFVAEPAGRRPGRRTPSPRTSTAAASPWTLPSDLRRQSDLSSHFSLRLPSSSVFVVA